MDLKRKFCTIILTIYVCRQTLCLHKLSFRRVMKIGSKTDKWKSDRALERIKKWSISTQILPCLHKFGFQRVMKIDFKTDK